MMEILHTYFIDPIIEDPIMCGLIPFVVGSIAGILSAKYNDYKKKKEAKDNG